MAIGPHHRYYPITGVTCLHWLQTVPTVCHLLINGLLAHPKRIGSRDWLRVRTCDKSDDLFLVWSCEIRSPDDLARASCFSESRAGLITGFTCGTFNLELWECDVVDCVHNTWHSTGIYMHVRATSSHIDWPDGESEIQASRGIIMV